jgi:CheY-like chemotaxis protein
MVLINMLKPVGFELLEAEDGYDVLKKIQQFHPDAVIMDLVMPKMDGFEAIRQIRSRWPEIRILACSADITPEAQARAESAGCSVFVSKPIKIQELLEAVGKELNLRWICEDLCQKPESEPNLIVFPPSDDLRQLSEAIHIGDMRKILDIAGEIQGRAPELEPFGKRLMTMARKFEIEEIRDFLSQNIPKSK